MNKEHFKATLKEKMISIGASFIGDEISSGSQLNNPFAFISKNTQQTELLQVFPRKIENPSDFYSTDSMIKVEWASSTMNNDEKDIFLGNICISVIKYAEHLKYHSREQMNQMEDVYFVIGSEKETESDTIEEIESFLNNLICWEKVNEKVHIIGMNKFIEIMEQKIKNFSSSTDQTLYKEIKETDDKRKVSLIIDFVNKKLMEKFNYPNVNYESNQLETEDDIVNKFELGLGFKWASDVKLNLKMFNIDCEVINKEIQDFHKGYEIAMSHLYLKINDRYYDPTHIKGVSNWEDFKEFKYL